MHFFKTRRCNGHGTAYQIVLSGLQPRLDSRPFRLYKHRRTLHPFRKLYRDIRIEPHKVAFGVGSRKGLKSTGHGEPQRGDIICRSSIRTNR